ncbi:Uncharacterised protein [Clostridium paraputrificum]|uniref:Uncharacterized protein n=1 Tax=Clostridium paraputrificum TaxID=29363 RepID=A0A6N3G1S4_9CLOT
MSKVNQIINNMEKVMVGKRKVIERIVIALLTNGHVPI